MISVSLTKTCYSLFGLKSINMLIFVFVHTCISWCYHRRTAQTGVNTLIMYIASWLNSQVYFIKSEIWCRWRYIENVVFCIYWFFLNIWYWDLRQFLW